MIIIKITRADDLFNEVIPCDTSIRSEVSVKAEYQTVNCR